MIDTHCHIDLYQQPEKILSECEKAGATIITMTNLPSHFEMGFPHVLPFKRIRMALGMHPLYAEQHIREFPTFLKNLHKTSYIGEIGLDFSRKGFSTKETQIVTFSKILAEINNQPKILSVHSRRAEKEVLDMLIKNRIQYAIFHWYSGPLNLIDKITEAGYFLSVNPAMIKSESGKKIIQRIPKDKLLTETDGPFVEIDHRPIKPGEVMGVYRYLSNVWEIPLIEVEKLISNNLKQIILIINK
ncbi:deoxyribonuclease [Pelobium manganitolerans]|uniref:Deoxyribonuclease n=1 Tax=Pelobium manganitolerans TaxID=1842495 RepID=A0A419S4X2_9SPHI|nr:Qat anti-phage system TatD family nuclease QatD [Pelobium manganitolerans]RKD15155.1 deoxyribonuclease [Pelobium manganitolerans]